MTKTNQFLKKVSHVVVALAVVAVPFLYANQASAAQITARKVTLSTSLSAATNVTYTFNFTVPTTGTSIKSASFQFCTTASGACSIPGSFAAGSAALASQPTNLGAASGWTNSNSSNSIRIVNAANSTNPTGAQTVVFNTVTNPTLANGTFFIRIGTFSDAAWTTPIDTGTVAASTAGAITVNATVDEALTFTLSSATISLGALTSGATGSNGTVTMTASTNAASGYAITYSAPNSLRSGSTDITAYTNGTSAPGTEGFGFNLMSNSTPSVGAGVSGAGGATAQAGYNTTNQYSFTPAGATIASVGVPSNTNVFTISYVANISPVTPAGAYTTTVTYVATPNF